MDLNEAAEAFREFVAVIQALRTPVTGCPWDLEQDHRTLRPYLVEETYEVLDAIDGGEDAALCEELGDLLLQVVLHAQVAADRGAFAITDVIRGIAAKMVRRHPHVFGSVQVSGSAEVLRNWEQIKAAEIQDKGADPRGAAALDRVPRGLPALLRAQRLGEKAVQLACNPPAGLELVDKLREDFAGLEVAVRAAQPDPPSAQLAQQLPEHLEQELGDVLFRLCQLASALDLNAEDSLQACNHRFVDRFRRREEKEKQAEGQDSAGPA
jgi:MazG family protein